MNALYYTVLNCYSATDPCPCGRGESSAKCCGVWPADDDSPDSVDPTAVMWRKYHPDLETCQVRCGVFYWTFWKREKVLSFSYWERGVYKVLSRGVVLSTYLLPAAVSTRQVPVQWSGSKRGDDDVCVLSGGKEKEHVWRVTADGAREELPLLIGQRFFSVILNEGSGERCTVRTVNHSHYFASTCAVRGWENKKGCLWWCLLAGLIVFRSGGSNLT